MIDAARSEGLPTEPLIDKALEGASKRANGQIIVTVVKGLVGDLRKAREARVNASDTALRAAQYRLLEDIAELSRLGVAQQTGDRFTERLVQEHEFLRPSFLRADALAPSPASPVPASGFELN